MTIEPTFRFLEEADIDRVLALVSDYSAELSRVPLDGARSREYRRYLLGTIGDAAHFVALVEVDGQLAGFADYRVERGRQDSRLMFGSIEEFYVLPAHRRRGLGRRMVRRALDHLRALGADLVELGVLKTNSVGDRFWDTLGFRDWSMRKRLYL